jgi:4-phosphopantoate--beta-alanine ligase
MGKTVIVVDLNPLSRSAKMASITIVDEISRVARNMLNLIETNELPDIAIEFNNNKNLQTSVNIIAENYRAV